MTNSNEINLAKQHFSIIIGSAFEIRNESDYEDFYIVSELEARQQLENANEFLAAAEKYINRISGEHL